MKKNIKQNISVLVLVILMMTLTPSTIADNDTIHTHGSCKKSYTTSSVLYNNGDGWTSFSLTPNSQIEIYYTDTGSYPVPTYAGHTYGYARPIGTDGTIYGTTNRIYRTHTTVWQPNTNGMVSYSSKFRIMNALYAEYGFSMSKMTLPNSATIIGYY